MHFLFEQFPDDRHDVGQRSAQAGQFCDDKRVSSFHAAHESSEFSGPSFFFPAHHFRNPAVYFQIAAVREFCDFVLLICQRLLFRTDP